MVGILGFLGIAKTAEIHLPQIRRRLEVDNFCGGICCWSDSDDQVIVIAQSVGKIRRSSPLRQRHSLGVM